MRAYDSRLMFAGSAVAALAFLTRQQGALIVPAVVLFLVVTRRPRFDRASVVLLLQAAALPALAAAGYALWLRYGNDVPRVQVSFFREVLEEGWRGAWWLARRLAVVDLIYLGFFTLPLMAAVIPFVRRLAVGLSGRGWLVFGVWAVVAISGVAALWMRSARMPYVAQFFGAGGLGPADILGSRPRIMTLDLRSALTIVCLIASLLLALVAARALRGGTGERTPPAIDGVNLGSYRARAGLVLSIALWQVVGVFPPSFHYIGWAAGSLDRYLLPLAPLAIALALWGLKESPLAMPLGWVVAIALALVSVAGTRDYLVFMREVWTMGGRALAAGVPLERLDAGSGWDGYHLYEYGLENRIRSRTPKGGPWWVYFYAPATDSAYVVAGRPLPGHSVVMKQPYSSWLSPRPAYLYLLRRYGEPWPPYSARGGHPLPPRQEREGLPEQPRGPARTAVTGTEAADD